MPYQSQSAKELSPTTRSKSKCSKPFEKKFYFKSGGGDSFERNLDEELNKC